MAKNWFCDGEFKTGDHCCWVDGVECSYLEINAANISAGRYWSCALLNELKSWAKVHADPRYLKDVRPAWSKDGKSIPDCGDWPGPGVKCATCGKVG